MYSSDISVDLKKKKIIYHKKKIENWKITLIDTGLETQTGGRIKRISKYLKDTFCLTYGDGLSDVDIGASIKFHQQHGKLATVTSVIPPGRYGALELEGDKVTGFIEKPRGEGGMINGGFFVLSPKCIDFIEGDASSWEEEPLSSIASSNQLMSFEHRGFWQPMDTLREKNLLESLWASRNPPWLIWDKNV